jgi:hypothetical protein
VNVLTPVEMAATGMPGRVGIGQKVLRRELLADLLHQTCNGSENDA